MKQCVWKLRNFETCFLIFVNGGIVYVFFWGGGDIGLRHQRNCNMQNAKCPIGKIHFLFICLGRSRKKQ